MSTTWVIAIYMIVGTIVARPFQSRLRSEFDQDKFEEYALIFLMGLVATVTWPLTVVLYALFRLAKWSRS